MKAMILAAGRGRRLGELTADKPKPLVEFRGKRIIDYALESISEAGINDCVINLHYKGEMLKTYLGSGIRWGLNITYSEEDRVLNTGGGVRRSLPLLGSDPFLLLNCDLFHNFDIGSLLPPTLGKDILAHLVLVPALSVAKDTSATGGDFSMRGDRVVPGKDFIFAGISIIHPGLFADENREAFPLADSFNSVINQDGLKGGLTGQVHKGEWFDIGTPSDLAIASQL